MPRESDYRTLGQAKIPQESAWNKDTSEARKAELTTSRTPLRRRSGIHLRQGKQFRWKSGDLNRNAKELRSEKTDTHFIK